MNALISQLDQAKIHRCFNLPGGFQIRVHEDGATLYEDHSHRKSYAPINQKLELDRNNRL